MIKSILATVALWTAFIATVALVAYILVYVYFIMGEFGILKDF